MSRSSTPQLPAMPRAVLESLDPDYTLVRIIRNKDPRLVARVRVQGRDCLLKTFRDARFWKRPGRRLRLQKEIVIYTELQRINFTWFRHPEVLHTDGRSYILTEFIQNNPALSREDTFFYTAAMQALLEFNSCNLDFEQKGCPGWIWEKTNRWKFSRSGKTIRNILEGALVRARLSPALLPGLLGFWGRAMAATRKLQKPLLVHRDIFQANILRPEPEKIYILDFEKTGMEKRWIFVDALKIAQAEPLFFDRSAERLSGFPRFYACLLENYWQGLLTRRPDINPEHSHFKLQLKFCLTGWILKKLVKEDPEPESSAGLIRFLQEVITGPEQHFEHWFTSLPRLPES